jgi:hypothetical protein
MKYCKDCLYYKAEDIEAYDKCTFNQDVTLVRATPKPTYCDIMRDEEYGKCGREAIHFVSAV